MSHFTLFILGWCLYLMLKPPRAEKRVVEIDGIAFSSYHILSSAFFFLDTFKERERSQLIGYENALLKHQYLVNHRRRIADG